MQPDTTPVLYGHQQQGAAWLASRPKALLAWEMGCGKSATAIRAADSVGAEHVLVLCPAVAKAMWAREFARFQTRERPVTIIHKATQPVPKTGVVILNYDHISRSEAPILKKLMAQQWDAIVCDEAHALKSRSAKRTKAVYGKRCDTVGGLVSVAKHVWLLTGTPMPNNASELWTHLRALTPEAIEVAPGLPMNEHQFIDRFCTWRDTPFGRQITGSRHLPDLRQRMEGFMDRKKKTDVLAELPPLMFDTLLVSPHECNHIPSSVLTELRHNETALTEHPAFEALVEETNDVVQALNQIRTDTHVTTQRRLTGLIKAEIALDLVPAELAGHKRKMIIFAHHTAVIDRLVAGLADTGLGVVKIDGRDNHDERDQAVHDFQNDPSIRVFVGQLDAAGTAITLTAASDVLFVEASWVPATNAQCAARAHRIGQRDGVLARFLTLEGSLDKQIMMALARKSKEIAELIDNIPAVPEPSLAFPPLP